MRPGTIWWYSCEAYKRRLRLLAKLLKLTNYVLFKCLLPYEAEVERDVELRHWALGVVIHPNVKIGRRVLIYHNVTLATESWIGSEHKIIVEDDVIIGAGAIVIGRGHQTLIIGRGSRIGAGAVVTDNVEAESVVVGVPARPIPRKSAKTGEEPRVPS